MAARWHVRAARCVCSLWPVAVVCAYVAVLTLSGIYGLPITTSRDDEGRVIDTAQHFVLPWVVVFFVTLAPIVIVVGAIVAVAIVGPIYLLGKALWDATADAEDRAKVSDDNNDDATTDTDSDIEAAVKYNG